MSILSMCEYVYKCMGMYDLFLCLEMERLYHIYQQLSELLSCNLLDDEVMFLVILERKVQINWFLWGGRGNDVSLCSVIVVKFIKHFVLYFSEFFIVWFVLASNIAWPLI